MSPFKSLFLLLLSLCIITSCNSTTESNQQEKSLKVMTYNILADPNNIAQRTPLLLEMMEASKCDVIALQETTSEFINSLLKCPWKKKYHCTKHNGVATAPRGLFFISRYPILRRFFKILPGNQRRGVLAIEVEIDGNKFTFATTHMESPLEDGPTRGKQLELIFSNLKASENVILMGDFNFGDGEQPETSKLSKTFSDGWLQLHPGDKGYTWNIEKSAMAKRGSFVGEKSRRLDRILYKSPKLKVTEIEIIGDSKKPTTAGLSFPSDHFGLEATFDLK